MWINLIFKIVTETALLEMTESKPQSRKNFNPNGLFILYILTANDCVSNTFLKHLLKSSSFYSTMIHGKKENLKIFVLLQNAVIVLRVACNI